jgi:hypothetical protein
MSMSASPRTEAGRSLIAECGECVTANDIVAIEDQAAAPAPLDVACLVKAIRTVYGPTILFDLAPKVAAEYARSSKKPVSA